jgi:hypothetical protein
MMPQVLGGFSRWDKYCQRPNATNSNEIEDLDETIN